MKSAYTDSVDGGVFPFSLEVIGVKKTSTSIIYLLLIIHPFVICREHVHSELIKSNMVKIFGIQLFKTIYFYK